MGEYCQKCGACSNVILRRIGEGWYCDDCKDGVRIAELEAENARLRKKEEKHTALIDYLKSQLRLTELDRNSAREELYMRREEVDGLRAALAHWQAIHGPKGDGFVPALMPEEPKA